MSIEHEIELITDLRAVAEPRQRTATLPFLKGSVPLSNVISTAIEPASPHRTKSKAALPQAAAVTVDGACALTSLRPSTVRNLIRDGKLRSRLVAGRRLIFTGSLMALLADSPKD